MLPLKSIYVTSPYGWRIHPVYKDERFHHGVDLRAHYVPVYSVAPGTVERSEWMGAYGNAIKIDHGGFVSFYAHLQLFNIKAGDIVTAGQKIATSGNTGTLTTAPHLHFGIYVNGESRDPLKFLEGLMEKAKVHYRGREFDARLDEGKTYVELRAFAEQFGCGVSYDFKTKESTVRGGVMEELEALAEKYRKGVK